MRSSTGHTTLAPAARPAPSSSAPAAELVLLRRSLVWIVVCGLPVVVVLVGAATRLIDGNPPPDGWHTVWLQSVVFYGLAPLAIGVAVLASLVWRPEHRGGNLNALMTSGFSGWRIVTTKAAVVAGLAAVMQPILLVCVASVGVLGFDMPGLTPARYVGVTALLMVATAPVAVVQSLLSMLTRSFVVPVAIAMVSAGASSAARLAIGDAALISPYALVTRTAVLGTGMFGDPGTVTPGGVAAILGATVVLTAAGLAVSAAVVARREV